MLNVFIILHDELDGRNGRYRQAVTGIYSPEKGFKKKSFLFLSRVLFLGMVWFRGILQAAKQGTLLVIHVM